MDARKSEVASQGEIVNDSQIFFEVTGPPTHGRVLGMGAGSILEMCMAQVHLANVVSNAKWIA